MEKTGKRLVLDITMIVGLIGAYVIDPIVEAINPKLSYTELVRTTERQQDEIDAIKKEVDSINYELLLEKFKNMDEHLLKSDKSMERIEKAVNDVEKLILQLHAGGGGN
ncbi:hypothetical protein JYU20_00455 [Bacteroidales bacterium AH-315-I05]|nr:hypothetical protein [Bacteroidales bacterium AH-315-I05]